MLPSRQGMGITLTSEQQPWSPAQDLLKTEPVIFQRGTGRDREDSTPVQEA